MIDVGYEQFLGPEMFFKPEFVDENWSHSLDYLVDSAI